MLSFLPPAATYSEYDSGFAARHRTHCIRIGDGKCDNIIDMFVYIHNIKNNNNNIITTTTVLGHVRIEYIVFIYFVYYIYINIEYMLFSISHVYTI